MTFIARVPEGKPVPARISLGSIVKAVEYTGKFKLWLRKEN